MKLSVAPIVKEIVDTALSEKGQKFICGTYSNGRARSVVDAMRDEYISPKDRERWDEIKKVKKKKGKKKKKKVNLSDDWISLLK